MRILTFVLCLLCFSVSAQIDWDFPYNPDSDNDGYIYSEDLLDLLAVYGQEYSSDELYLSQDSSSLIVKVGNMNPFDCHVACEELEGNWRVITTRELIKYRDQLSMDDLTSSVGAGSFDDLATWMFVTNNSGDIAPPAWQMQALSRNGIPNGWNGSGYNEIYPPFTSSLSINSQYGSNIHECWCATNQRPRVEYKMLELGSNYEELMIEVEVLSNQGWYLHNSMPHPQGNGTTHFVMWRWAE